MQKKICHTVNKIFSEGYATENIPLFPELIINESCGCKSEKRRMKFNSSAPYNELMNKFYRFQDENIILSNVSEHIQQCKSFEDIAAEMRKDDPHIGVDKDSGLVHHLEVTGANEHDVTATPDLMYGEEEELYGDSVYIGAEKRENAVVKNKNGRKIKYKINRKPSTMKKLSKSGQYAAKKAEHKKSSVRSKVEHVFAVVKRLFGYRKTRYRGLRKQTAKLNIMFALANLYLADRKSLTA